MTDEDRREVRDAVVAAVREMVATGRQVDRDAAHRLAQAWQDVEDRRTDR